MSIKCTCLNCGDESELEFDCGSVKRISVPYCSKCHKVNSDSECNEDKDEGEE